MLVPPADVSPQIITTAPPTVVQKLWVVESPVQTIVSAENIFALPNKILQLNGIEPFVRSAART